MLHGMEYFLGSNTDAESAGEEYSYSTIKDGDISYYLENGSGKGTLCRYVFSALRRA